MIQKDYIRRIGAAWLEELLALSVLALVLQFVGPLVWSSFIYPLIADEEKYALRNADFPDTYISLIHLDLTSPHHDVTLSWTGHQAAKQDLGPFRSSPGSGLGYNDCNDPVESNCFGSECTPKGERTVEGFADAFDKLPVCKYLTFVDRQRAISFHSHPKVPDYPASQGCIRLDSYAAQLIHNNSIVGVTRVLVDGEWTNPNKVADAKLK